ncbi:MAG: hypothetical protein HC837_13230 [Chloroflexaceae bacterium]|nr:hypothetical protein [Chloroflexaceae bacterium]
MAQPHDISLHVRFNGQSEELDLAVLHLGADVSDTALREALARHYDCSQEALDEYVIVREPQAIIVRPLAIYG